MKKILLFSAMLLVVASCQKDKPIEEYKRSVEECMAVYPDGFVLNLNNNNLVKEGYVLDLGPEGDFTLEQEIEQALSSDRAIAGWEDDNKASYQSVKIITDRDKAIAYARKQNLEVIFDLKNKVPVYTKIADEFTAGKTVTSGKVSIEAKADKYYLVTIDFKGATKEGMKQIGKDYAKCINQLNLWYTSRLYVYLTASVWIEDIDDYWGRVQDIKPTLNPDYISLMDGFASEMKKCPFVTREKLIYTANLLPDVLRPTSCSAYGVMPEMSVTSKTLVHRNLDWPDKALGIYFPKGREGIVAPLQSVTKMIFDNNKTIYSFGVLGLFPAVTAIDATNGNMVGILDSGVKGTYSSSGKRSYVFDLMTALRTYNTTDEIAAEMTKSTSQYAFNHLILLADKKEVRIVENNFTGTGKRAVRTSASTLAKHVPEWKFPNVIAAVNCFMLEGQINNFNSVNGTTLNSLRWDQQINETKKILDAKTDKRLTMDEVRKIQSYYKTGELNDDWYKNLYNNYTFQMIEYVPGATEVEVFFKPFNASVPATPTFIKVPLN